MSGVSRVHPGCAAGALSLGGAGAAWIAAMIVAAWAIGRMLTDRYGWSQWLWWIPTPALAPVVLLGLLAALRPASRPRVRPRRAAVWSATAAAIALYWTLAEHRMLRPAPDISAAPNAIKIVHWNAEPAIWLDMQPSALEIIRLNGDITILTNPAGLLEFDVTREWISNSGIQVVAAFPFAIATRVPIRSIRPLIHVDQMHLVVVEFEVRGLPGDALTMYLIDMPSDPRLGRMSLMRRMRAMLNELKAPPADVALGDFNATRSSASIRTLLPHMRHAFDQAGHGYGATYHRAWNLWHIDHVLTGDDVHVLRYDLIDPKISRHRAQVAWIVPVAGP